VHGYRIDEHGGPEVLVWRELPDPEPGPGEVRVRIRAVALNHLDLWVRKGVPGHTFPLPLVPGAESAGTADALGEGVDDLEAGAPVLIAPGVSCGACPRCLASEEWLCRDYGLLGEHRDGAAAELVVVPRRNLFPIPAGLSYVEAASVPLVFLTAWHMLVARAAMRKGEDVLLHAAGSGVTTAGIQIAKLLGAGRIIASSSSPSKRERALELGATDVVDSTDPAFPKAVRALTGGKGVDVVFDHVGGELLERSFRCLGWGGRVVVCGSTAAGEATIPMRALFFKSLSLLGSTMGSLAELAEVLGHVASGALWPVVADTLPIERLGAAHHKLEERGVFGKLVMTFGDGAFEVPYPVPPTD